MLHTFRLRLQINHVCILRSTTSPSPFSRSCFFRFCSCLFLCRLNLFYHPSFPSFALCSFLLALSFCFSSLSSSLSFSVSSFSRENPPTFTTTRFCFKLSSFLLRVGAEVFRFHFRQEPWERNHARFAASERRWRSVF